ncbi:MAG: hypothetical protein ABR562_00460 [Thermoplasmatota archaeon]|nr:hypothetical protein [Halobacteriales archaeon]
MIHVAMPSHRRGQKMAFHFDEDEVTLAWEAMRAARLGPGTGVAPVGIPLPAWWWQGTGLVASVDAALSLQPIPTTLGPSVCVHGSGPAPDVEDEAKRIHAAAPALPEAAWQKVRLARDGPDTEADFPLGAFVTAARHEEVTAQRMRLGAGRVRTWTTIGAGAAPAEFLRLQDAVGAYHVVLVESGPHRTVGLWTGTGAPATGAEVRPVLRRLFRTQGAWRYGVKFAPA